MSMNWEEGVFDGTKWIGHDDATDADYEASDAYYAGEHRRLDREQYGTSTLRSTNDEQRKERDSNFYVAFMGVQRNIKSMVFDLAEGDTVRINRTWRRLRRYWSEMSEAEPEQAALVAQVLSDLAATEEVH
jgi:hypothetical protein